MENIFPNVSELLGDSVNNYAQGLLLLAITKDKWETLEEIMKTPFSTFVENKIQKYQKENKWKDLINFLAKNQEVIKVFQKEFDDLIQEIYNWKKINPRDFSKKWNDESKWVDPF